MSQRKSCLVELPSLQRAKKLFYPALTLTLALPAHAVTDELASVEPLARMSLEELANVQVTSVSKAPEQLRAAPAVVYVITHDEIMHSGATSIPEA
ncbi:MAG: hypothetical protein ABUL58_01775, partial [Steroidobacter sp.]